MLRTTAFFLTLSTAALAEVPQVMTDIAPIQSLAARVMAGIGAPDVLLPPGASPHDYALRPSDAARLAETDLMIWVGHGLTPWLEGPIASLAADAQHLELLKTTGWTALPLRSDPAFAEAEAAEHPADAQGAEEQVEEGHAAATGAADTDLADAGTDPHAWLDPSNAAVFMTLMAEDLARLDPANAAAYRANAAAAGHEMTRLRAEGLGMLADHAGGRYIVPHDAYQYFESGFGMPAAGAISLTDAAAPGPARVAALQQMVASGAVTCILTDPQTSPAWSGLLAEGTLARTALVDPDGGSQSAETLAGLYPAIIRSLVAGLAECLG